MPPGLSVCLIVRDEAEDLPRCLASVQGVAGEIIVVDTGSTDGTPDVAAALGARVFHLPWPGSFAAARNHALDQATGEWVLVLDADEELHPEDRDKVPPLLAARNVEGYLNTQVNFVGDRPGGEVELGFALRLFRNRPDRRYRGAIHERVDVPAGRLRTAPLRILHYGYLASRVQARGKRQRNLALVQAMAAEAPDDPLVRFYLASEYLALGRWTEAIQELRAARDPALAQGFLFASKLVKGLVHALVQVGDPEGALAELALGLRHFPAFTDLVFLQGVAYRLLGRLPEAVGCFHQCLAMGPAAAPPHLGVDPAMGGWRAHQALGDLYERLGDPDQAARHYGWAWEAGREPARHALLRLAVLRAAAVGDRAAAEVAALVDPASGVEALCLAEALCAARLWEPALAALARVPDPVEPVRRALVAARCRFSLGDCAGAAAALAGPAAGADPGLWAAAAFSAGTRTARDLGGLPVLRAAVKTLLEARVEALARGLYHRPGDPHLKTALARAVQEVRGHGG